MERSSVKARLLAYNRRRLHGRTALTRKHTEQDVANLLRQLYQQTSRHQQRQHTTATSETTTAIATAITAASIPPFFKHRTKVTAARKHMRKEARTRFLEKKADSLLSETEVDGLWERILVHGQLRARRRSSSTQKVAADRASSNGTHTDGGNDGNCSTKEEDGTVENHEIILDTVSGDDKSATTVTPTWRHATVTTMHEPPYWLDYKAFCAVKEDIRGGRSGGAAPQHPTRRDDATSREQEQVASDPAAASSLRKALPFFQPSVFLKFPIDAYGRISGRAFVRYVVRICRLTRLRILLTCYDEGGDGFLTEQDLENYVFEQISSLPGLNGLEEDFFPYYVFTAVRKFMFFLDFSRKGRIAIRQLIASPILNQFNQLRQESTPKSPNNEQEGQVHVSPVKSGSDDTEGDGDEPSQNWFSAQSALAVYAHYLSLDADQNGMLRKSEFLKYNGGALTHVFVDRIFQEYPMYTSKENGELEMDYKMFLDFVLAMNHKNTPQGIAFFWPLLDVEKKGYLDDFAIICFLRCVIEKKLGKTDEVLLPSVATMINEIFDMVQPEVPRHITKHDLVRSGSGDSVISILVDVNRFCCFFFPESA